MIYGEKTDLKHLLTLSHTANEGLVRIQYKCLLLILYIPRNETELPRNFQNRIIMFCLLFSTIMYL
jgi:hypothetical protein